MLTHRNATTYHLGDGHRQKQLAEFGVTILSDTPIVTDDNIITSYNPSTAFDVAFLLLERQIGRASCRERVYVLV